MNGPLKKFTLNIFKDLNNDSTTPPWRHLLAVFRNYSWPVSLSWEQYVTHPVLTSTFLGNRQTSFPRRNSDLDLFSLRHFLHDPSLTVGYTWNNIKHLLIVFHWLVRMSVPSSFLQLYVFLERPTFLPSPSWSVFEYIPSVGFFCSSF